MPYISKDSRHKFDKAIKELSTYISHKGDLNYVISEIVGQLLLKGEIGYTTISNWIDGVHGAERELTRRLLNPYEDLKIEQNGDVPSFHEVLRRMR
jgi:hypothetical protein